MVYIIYSFFKTYIIAKTYNIIPVIAESRVNCFPNNYWKFKFNSIIYSNFYPIYIYGTCVHFSLRYC